MTKKKLSHLHKYSDPLLSTLLKHLWQRLQPGVFLGMTLHTILAHLYLWRFSHSFLQILSNSVWFDMERHCTAIFRSLKRCSNGFKSKLCLGHSRTFRDLSQSHYCVVLAVCLGLLFCWKMNRHLSLNTLEQVFITDVSLLCSFPSILTSLPVPVAEKHPHSMMLPSPLYHKGLIGRVLQRWLSLWKVLPTPKRNSGALSE